MLRQHVGRQLVAQSIAQLGEPGRVVHRCRHVQHQPHVVVAEGLRHRNAFAHGRVGARRRFDIARFDAITANLQLMIHAAVEEQHAIAFTAQVAGAVHARSVRREWIGAKPFRGEVVAEQITVGHAITANPDFTHLALRHRLLLLIEDVDARAGDRAAQRHRARTRLHLDKGGPDRGFGGAVHVPQLAAFPGQQGGGGPRQFLAAHQQFELAHDASGIVVGQHPQQRGSRLQHAGLALAQQLQQRVGVTLPRIAGHHHTGTGDQGQVKLEAGDVERKGGDRAQHIRFVDTRLCTHAG